MIRSLVALLRQRAVLLSGGLVLASIAVGWGAYAGQRKVLLLLLAFTAVVLLRRGSFTDFYFVTITCALLSHFTIPAIRDEFERYKWESLFLMAAVSLVTALVAIRAPPWPRFVHVFALALVVLSVRSVGWSLDPWHSFRKAGVFVLMLVVAFVGAWCFAGTLERVRRILDLHVHWLWLVFPATLLSIAVPGIATHDGAGRLRGPFENPNNLGFFASTTLPLVFAYLVTDERRRVRVSAAILLASGAVAAFLAGARGGMIGAALGIGAYCALRWPRAALKAAAVAAIGFAFAFAYRVDTGAVGEAVVKAFRPETLSNLSDRMVSWEVGLMIGGTRPWLGHGFGLGDLLYPMYGFEMFIGHFAPSVHNSFLDTYMNLGSVGVGLLAAVQLAAGWAGLLTWLNDREGRTGLLALGLLCAFVSSTAHGAIETIFMSPGTPWAVPYWVSAVLLVRLRTLQAAGATWAPPEVVEASQAEGSGCSTVVPLRPGIGA